MTSTKELAAALRVGTTDPVTGGPLDDDVYAHVAAADVREAADRLEALEAPVEGMTLETTEALDYLRAGTEEYGSYPGDITTVYDKTHLKIANLIDRLSSALAAERIDHDELKNRLTSTETALAAEQERADEWKELAALRNKQWTAERAEKERLAEALRSISNHWETGWAAYDNHDPLPRHEVIRKVERIARAALAGQAGGTDMTEAIETARGDLQQTFRDHGIHPFDATRWSGRIEALVRAIILDAREAKAEPADDVTAPHISSLVHEAAIAERDARIAELEREKGALDANYQTAQANWDLTLDRAEKAEAALAELRGRVEKAADELLFVPANSGSMKMPEARAHVLAALKILVPSHPFLSPEGEAKGEVPRHIPQAYYDGRDGGAIDEMEPEAPPPRDADPLPAMDDKDAGDDATTEMFAALNWLWNGHSGRWKDYVCEGCVTQIEQALRAARFAGITQGGTDV